MVGKGRRGTEQMRIKMKEIFKGQVWGEQEKILCGYRDGGSERVSTEERVPFQSK